MQDLFASALAPGVSLYDFFMTHMPEIHERRKAEFATVSEQPLILSFGFDDVDERYTLELSEGGCEVEDDEMVDFPQVTMMCQGEQWEAVKPDLLELTRTLESSQSKLESAYGGKPITRRILDEFERFEGTIRVEVTGGSAPEPVLIEVVLNDYVPNEDADHILVKVDFGVVLKMARGELHPRDAQGSVSISGKTGFGLKLAGFLSTHFE